MESVDPITLAIIAVVVAIVLSALLLLLFATREEKYEDVLAAQRSEQEAYMARTASTKPVKQRKKLGKGKKKYSDDGEGQEEVSSLQVEETIESNVEISRSNNLDAVLDVEFLPDRPEEKIPVPEEKPSSGITKDRQGKKKSKKVVVKEDTSSVTERRVILDKPREVEEMVSQVVDSTVDSEPDKPEDFETEQPKTLNTSEAGAPAKKSKSKPKTAKDRDPIQGEVSVKRLMEMVTVSNLNSTEIQSLIDVLLNKQGENSQWKKSSSKGDTLELLKKQLQEKETQISEERRQSQNAANKLKELRDELQQEKQKNKSQQANATSKITAQTKEIQALQTRMQASHDSHTLEVQTLQTQLHQLQDVMSSSSVGNIQRLQEENSQLKNASMRAAQLTADKESLTTELTKLQQTCRHVKGELGTKIDQLSQSEEKVRQLTIHQNSVKEAENVLSKRLAEVNEELQKSQARNTALQKDLNSTAQGLKAEEAKTSELNKRLSELSAADSSQADALHSLTAKLQEATARVSELQKIVADVEDQLKKSQEVKMQKDKEIQVLQGELKLARESVQTSVSNHVSSAAPAENGKEPNVSAKIQEDALKVKEDVIAELNSNVLKKDEEIASLKSLLDEQKNKNNELRKKNWKAMEAVNDAEKNAQAQINKALEAAKVANDAVANGQSDVVKEKDDAITKLTEELEEKKEECSKLENVIQQQKDKNNELREKNWKAMDALSNMEKSVNSKIKSAVESVKGENKTIMLEEQNETKAVLCRVHPNVMVDSTLPYKKWLGEFEKQASKSSGDSEELEELTRKFKEVQAQKDTLVAECAHYKVTLQETESLLKKLEDNVESEMDNWQKIVERTQRELKEANDKISTLEGDLQKTTGSASSQLDTIASLEQHLKDARAADSEAKQRFSELQEQLAKSTVSEDSDKVRNLEKELEVLRAQDREPTDTISKLESTEKDLIKCKQQMETSVKEIAERDNDLKTAKGELAKVQSSEEELKKKVVSLEEALTKANNDLGKSQESLDSLNNSPDKKKKGLKGALNKVMSKKDKEKEDGKLEEAQRMLTEQRAEIDDLKNSKQALEKQHKALEVEYKELKRLSISVESVRSDKDAIVAILGARSNKQRQEIAAKYQQKYNRNLTEELKSELSGKFQDAAVALMAVPENYDAVSLHDAMSGLGTDEQVLIEILSSRSYEELQVIKSAYTKIYTGKDVLKKIKEDTNGEFRTTLMNLIEKNRDSNEKVNEDLAKADARKLLEAGQGKKGADKAVFVEILTSRNYAQLRATFDAYKTLAKSDFMDSINEYLKGDLQNALRAIVRCAQDPALFFAEVLEKALDRGNSKIVTRVLVTRSEVDLADIKTQYQKKTGQPLKDVVAKKMKGDLEKILLQLLGN
ncbi:myosin-4-like [Stylophora pistillata]|uniref:myosin-4-like n=1 Tax=Stylophora pistillata TaxID=50429 RepID=UPI000C057C09|nr:myosin-4-like [Stylophora pistillata]